jgi:intracellular multiplication protein IcmG
VGQLEMTLEDLQTQFAMMSQLAQGMSQQLQQQTASKMVTVVAKPMHEKKKMASHHKAVEASAYYIQALVPGRAWLVNQKGTATTVSVGDEVPGYGVITVIDLDQGIVLTDKGQIIRYHSGDR